ncbi:unnamed protein product [Leptosia nina]|uniref:Uncharacterized protein n=1 Tax=Leptosia nina TaxID=320188 RepID=A0AAV1K353_9NEOP
MIKILIISVFIAFSHGYAVGPVHIAVPYVNHGYHSHRLGFGFSHGLTPHIKPIGHHLFKRSPFIVQPFDHTGHVADIAPIAVSHQARVDFHSRPAVVVPIVPVVKEVSPVVQAAPIYKPFGHYVGVHGLIHPHLRH